MRPHHPEGSHANPAANEVPRRVVRGLSSGSDAHQRIGSSCLSTQLRGTISLVSDGRWGWREP